MAEGKENEKYKGLQPSIASEIEGYEMAYFRQDKPVPFVGGLEIHPITMKDYEMFYSCTSCLTLEKNKTIEGLRLTYLDFLWSKMKEPNEEGKSLSFKLQKLCELVFHVHNGIKCKKCGHIINYTGVELMQYIKQVQEAQSKGEEPPTMKCSQCEGED